MANEVELKLSIDPKDVNPLTQWLTEQYQSPEEQTLVNRYFDTPQQALAAHRMALRVRSVDNAHTMTLKTAGSSAGGLHDRQEYDWPVTGNELSLAELAEPLAATDIDSKALQPQFATNFVRRAWQLNFQHSEIEVALDVGQVEVDDRTDAICELELELIDGLPEELFSLANHIARHFALRLNNCSKAAKGARLQQTKPTPPTVPGSEAIGDQFAAFIDALERYEFDHCQAALTVAAASLANLRLLASLVVPALESDLLNVQKHFQPALSLLPATVACDSKQARIKQQVDKLLTHRELGQSLIAIAQGIYSAPSTTD